MVHMRYCGLEIHVYCIFNILMELRLTAISCCNDIHVNIYTQFATNNFTIETLPPIFQARQ